MLSVACLLIYGGGICAIRRQLLLLLLKIRACPPDARRELLIRALVHAGAAEQQTFTIQLGAVKAPSICTKSVQCLFC